jgi:hypothetical protein
LHEVDWKEVCPASLPYSGLRRNPAEVAEFFASLDQVEDVTVFEAREFIEAGEKVTVLGYLESSRVMQVFQANRSSTFVWRGFPRAKRIP